MIIKINKRLISTLTSILYIAKISIICNINKKMATEL
uniref:Uncharacterized protein n=1 Tax=Geladintestivirus 4 TaxID=3233136 RepID=A0AAU8MHJ3_9CAUD